MHGSNEDIRTKHHQQPTNNQGMKNKKRYANVDYYLDIFKTYEHVLNLDGENIQDIEPKKYSTDDAPLKTRQFHEDAIPFIQHETAFNMRKANFYQALGKQLCSMGRYQQAGCAYRRASQLTTYHYKLYHTLMENIIHTANTYRENKAYKDAYLLYQLALLFSPENAQTYAELGLLYTMNGDYKKSGAYYREAISRNPYYTKIYEDICKNLYQQAKKLDKLNKYEEANSLYKQILLFLQS